MKNMININDISSLKRSQEKHKIQMTQYRVYIWSKYIILGMFVIAILFGINHLWGLLDKIALTNYSLEMCKHDKTGNSCNLLFNSNLPRLKYYLYPEELKYYIIASGGAIGAMVLAFRSIFVHKFDYTEKNDLPDTRKESSSENKILQDTETEKDIGD